MESTKSSVKLSFLNSLLPFSLEEGRKLNAERCKRVDNQQFSRIQYQAKKRNLKLKRPLWKVQYPFTPNLKCQHQNGFVLNRSKLLSSDHLNLLATPKKRIVPSNPIFAKRKIPSSGPIINNLAQPKAFQLLDNFEIHLKHLSIFQTEKFLNKVFGKKYNSPEETIQTIIKSQQEHCVDYNKRMKNNRWFEQMPTASDEAINYLRRYIREQPNLELQLKASKFNKHSDVILVKLCNLMNQNLPRQISNDLVDKFFVDLANKIATSMTELVECSRFMNISQCDLSNECIQEHQENCYPIENCCIKQVQDTLGSDVEYQDSLPVSSSNESIYESLISDEQKTSFLSLSKVLINQEICQDLFGQLERLKALKAEKASIKAAKKLARALKRQEMKDMKAKALAGYCFGDVNKKPQWQVDWKNN